MNPAEDEGKGNSEGHHASPGKTQVRHPTQATPTRDKSLRREGVHCKLSDVNAVGQGPSFTPESPVLEPIPLCWRALDPRCAAVCYSPGGENSGQSVRQKRPVKMPQAVRAQHYQGCHGCCSADS